MSFYNNLKKPDPPRRAEPVVSSEEIIQKLMQSEEIQGRASAMMSQIKNACISAKWDGKRRVYGRISSWVEKYDSEGYSLIHPSYKAYFYAWPNGVRETTTVQENPSGYLTRPVDSFEQQQAFLRILNSLLAQDGFPQDCLHPFTYTTNYKTQQKVPGILFSRTIDTYTAVEDYSIEVDIRW